MQDKFEEAKKAFDNGLSFDPENGLAWAYLAISKYKLGDRQGALEDANRAYFISPGKGTLSVLRAIENNKEIDLH